MLGAEEAEMADRLGPDIGGPDGDHLRLDRGGPGRGLDVAGDDGRSEQPVVLGGVDARGSIDVGSGRGILGYERLHALDRERVRDLWPDFEAYQPRCRFPNCTHDHEPDCAVFDAVDTGALPASRYASYVELLDEVDPDNAYDPEDGDVMPEEGME